MSWSEFEFGDMDDLGSWCLSTRTRAQGRRRGLGGFGFRASRLARIAV